MLTRKQALELLDEKKANHFIIDHSIQVNKVANYLANELLKKGIEINLELVDIGSLLHDIGRTVSAKEHAKIGKEILEEIGEKEIAKIINTHGIEEDNIPKTWEEKVVSYSDKRLINDTRASLNQRLQGLYKKYPDLKEVIQKAEPIAKKIEKEIFDIIGWEKEPLTEIR